MVMNKSPSNDFQITHGPVGGSSEGVWIKKWIKKMGVSIGVSLEMECCSLLFIVEKNPMEKWMTAGSPISGNLQMRIKRFSKCPVKLGL